MPADSGKTTSSRAPAQPSQRGRCSVREPPRRGLRMMIFMQVSPSFPLLTSSWDIIFGYFLSNRLNAKKTL